MRRRLNCRSPEAPGLIPMRAPSRGNWRQIPSSWSRFCHLMVVGNDDSRFTAARRHLSVSALFTSDVTFRCDDVIRASATVNSHGHSCQPFRPNETSSHYHDKYTFHWSYERRPTCGLLTYTRRVLGLTRLLHCVGS